MSDPTLPTNPMRDLDAAFRTVLACCHRLCAEHAPGPEIAGWLGVIEHVSRDKTWFIVRPFDEAWERAQISVGKDDWLVGHIRLDAAAGVRVPAAMLEAAFGEGNEMTRLHWDSPVSFGFTHSAGDFRCRVFAEIERPHEEGAPRCFTTITVRRDGRVPSGEHR